MATIQTSDEKDALIVDLPEEVTGDFGDSLISESKAWLLKPCTRIIYNFKRVKMLKASSYRAFVVTSRLAKQGDKQIISINMNVDICRQLKAEGVVDSFNPMANATGGDTSQPKPKGVGIDVQFINPFIEAVIKTLEVQARTKSTPGKPRLLKVNEKEYSPPIGIVGLIQLNTPKVNGSIALVFSEMVFLKIYENMFGEKHDKITGELQDAAAEILNIIYGTAKAVLNAGPGYDLQPVIPTVLSGEKINLHQNTREKIIILPFESAAGPFQMEIASEPKKRG